MKRLVADVMAALVILLLFLLVVWAIKAVVAGIML